MLKFFKLLYLKFLVRFNIDQIHWNNICELSDPDMLISVHRKAFSNDLIIEIFDKDILEDKLIRRNYYVSKGDLKYATMSGFSPYVGCEDTESTLDEIIKANE